MAFEWDLDDELSQCYTRKDMDKFWKKWQQRFSKRRCAPAHIEGFTDAQCIAERFKMSFSEHSFDSYSDSESVTQLCACLRNRLSVIGLHLVCRILKRRLRV